MIKVQSTLVKKINQSALGKTGNDTRTSISKPLKNKRFYYSIWQNQEWSRSHSTKTTMLELFQTMKTNPLAVALLAAVTQTWVPALLGHLLFQSYTVRTWRGMINSCIDIEHWCTCKCMDSQHGSRLTYMIMSICLEIWIWWWYPQMCLFFEIGWLFAP